MQKVATCLMFVGEQHGKAEEAINLYTALVKDSKILQITRYGVGEQGIEGTVKVATFTLNGQEFQAMERTLGDDAEAVMKELAKRGLTRSLAKQAVESVAGGRFTIFALVDALTRLAQKAECVGDRTAIDVQAAALFTLAA